MKISYAITVCNEIEEIKRLIPFLLKHKRDEDEIVVQQDNGGQLDNGVYTYLTSDGIKNNITFLIHELDKDFAQFKNHLTQQCSGDYIFQIDADEIPNEYLIAVLPELLEENNEIDVFLVPRVNTVEGLTSEHIAKWGWRVNDEGWVNWPDYQMRLYKNDPSIKWEGKVHEKITGFKTWTKFPEALEIALFHPKQIERQEKQNEFYETI
jgi:glycosyltransferase involved in cell wall biosynthesis